MSQINIYTEPPFAPIGVLRIYSNPGCPFVQRIRLLAASKGIKTEEINIHLKDKPQWYLEKINPFGQVPTIEYNGHLIRESLIAFDYVDEEFGGESMWPTDPYRKAQSRLFVDDFSKKFIPNYYKHYGEECEKQAPYTNEVANFIDIIEQTLKRHESVAKGSPFLGGVEGTPRAVDFLVWPWLERLQGLLLIHSGLGSLITKEKFPLYFAYVESMAQNAAVQQSYYPPVVHAAMVKSLMRGVHDYSILDTQGTGITIYNKERVVQNQE